MIKVLVKIVRNKNDVIKFFNDIFKELKPKLYKKRELLLKPNFVLEDIRCITNPYLVIELARFLKNVGYNISIGDGGYFKETADRIREKYFGEEFKFYNFSKGEFIIKTLDKGIVLKNVPVNVKSLKFRDNFISIPKLKVHTLAKVSLSFKNNMGFLKKPASFMHKNFDEKIVDLFTLFKPKLIIIDGITGGEISEMICKEVKHNILIASNDAVAADTVASYIMGFDPKEIGYLRIAENRGFGIVDLNSYEIISDVKLEFIRKKYLVV